MTIKKQHTIVKVTPEDGPFIDQNFDTLYKNKTEGRYYSDSGTTITYLYQSIQTGKVVLPSNGTASASSTVVTLSEKVGNPLFAASNKMDTRKGVSVVVTDLTQTTLTLTVYQDLQAASNTLNTLTSGCDTTVTYMVIGANP